MDFLVLGPLQVRSDEGTTVPVDAAKQRAVLGVLVANVDRVVSVDRLLEEVWGDELPKGGAKTLRYHISKLRDTLQPGRRPGEEGAVATVAGGYVLRLEPDQLDAWRFESLADEGRTTGYVHPAPRARELQREAASIQATLGQPAYYAARAEGESMNDAELIA